MSMEAKGTLFLLLTHSLTHSLTHTHSLGLSLSLSVCAVHCTKLWRWATTTQTSPKCRPSGTQRPLPPMPKPQRAHWRSPPSAQGRCATFSWSTTLPACAPLWTPRYGTLPPATQAHRHTGTDTKHPGGWPALSVCVSLWGCNECQVTDLAHEELPQIYAVTGRGLQSSLRILRYLILPHPHDTQ
jgi:hypothetical protein